VSRVYSTYEAKAKFSEVLRKVRAGQRVLITFRGEIVAQMAPVEPAKQTLASRLEQLEATGVIGPPGKPSGGFPRFQRRPGALTRFLRSRD